LRKQAERNARTQAAEKARKLAAETIPFTLPFALPGLDGKTYTFDDLKGKLTIVTFWGTWCAPCRREIPRYRELLAKYREQGLKIIGINYERVPPDDAKGTVRAFVKKHEIPYPCLIGDDALLGQLPGFVGYPTTLFLDDTGKVRIKAVGECSSLELEAIVTLLLQSPAQP
jgi:thiol-disulfide isomerase/thioredoxin